MTTPEAKVKQHVRRALAQYPTYAITPATHGFGASGAPDIVVCWRGRFIGIECKANGNVPTALQRHNLTKIIEAGGISILIDQSGMGVLRMLLNEWDANGLPSGVFFDLLDSDDEKQTK